MGWKGAGGVACPGVESARLLFELQARVARRYRAHLHLRRTPPYIVSSGLKRGERERASERERERELGEVTGCSTPSQMPGTSMQRALLARLRNGGSGLNESVLPRDQTTCSGGMLSAAWVPGLGSPTSIQGSTGEGHDIVADTLLLQARPYVVQKPAVAARSENRRELSLLLPCLNSASCFEAESSF